MRLSTRRRAALPLGTATGLLASVALFSVPRHLSVSHPVCAQMGATEFACTIGYNFSGRPKLPISGCPKLPPTFEWIRLVQRVPVRAILEHIGEPTRPPVISPARVRPTWREDLIPVNLGYEPLAQPEPEIEFDQRIQW